MNFSFICPQRKMTFETADFSVIEHKGVICDSSGNRTLDAKVKLNEPCPFCGEKHVYHASDLTCPFDIPGNISRTKKGKQ